MRRILRIIRNILLALIAVIVAVAAVLALNVFSHGSRQLQVATIPKAQVDAQAAAARLAEAIRFRTISSYEKPEQHADALRGMHAHIEKSFPAFHAAAKREVVADYSLPTRGRGPIRRRSRSACSRIRMSCRSRRGPTRTGGTRHTMA